MAFAQILVGGGVRLDIDSVITHVGELFPGDRLSTAEAAAGDAFGPRFQASKSCRLITVMPRSFNSFICASNMGGVISVPG